MNDGNSYVATLNGDSARRIFDSNWFDNRWNADNRFLFVRKSFLFLAVFILLVEAVLFVHIFASHRYVFFLLQTSNLPRRLYEKFEKVELRRSAYHEGIFLIRSNIASEKNLFDEIREQRVYFCTKCKV